MADDSTTLRAGHQDDALLLHAGGRLTAEFCPAIKAYCNEDGHGACRRVHVHLHECIYFDSTFLGTLLCLRGKFGEEGVILMTPSEECLEGLKRMGAHVLFPILKDPLPGDVDWTSLTERVASRDEFDFQHNVLEAHVELARMPGPMQKVYEPIARQAQKEFDEKFNWDSDTIRMPRPK
ncbi:MAG: STAS domain-containing protein [Planctomycetaceae bacterium]|nr:STAS domain-containing protein [Planctomycetaceae bacterium]